MDNNAKINSVEDYFNGQPDNVKNTLLQIKQCIFKVAPDAEELLNYNIPAYALIKNGEREQQIMIAGYKNHVGLYPHPTTIEKFNEELKEYKKGKGSIQFSINKPLPEELITQMIEYRLNLLTK